MVVVNKKTVAACWTEGVQEVPAHGDNCTKVNGDQSPAPLLCIRFDHDTWLFFQLKISVRLW